MAFPLVAVPVRDLLEKEVKLLEAILGKLDHIEKALVPAVPPEVPLPPTVVVVETVEKPDENYTVFPIDLTVAHTDEPLGLKGANVVARNLSVVKADSAFSIKLNSKGNKPVSCEKGTQVENFKMTELYYTNAALTGTAELYASWR